MFFVPLALAVLLSATVCSAAPPPSPREEAMSLFVEEMSSRHGFDRAVLESRLRSARSLPQILELMDRAAEPRPWDDYRSSFVNPEGISAGGRFWLENAGTLELAHQRFGVPGEVIAAVIGIETHFGKNQGRFEVLDALATLAFEYPRRASEFRLQLEHFLLLSREESLPLRGTLGSYAGAMGIPQFMPGSYRRYAIDFDGDGRRDLFGSVSDAIGSVANYLTAHGWQRNAPVAAPAEVEGGGIAPFRTPRLTARYPLAELQLLGVSTAGAHPESRSAIPLTLKAKSGPEYWLGFENFYVITRYNRSVYYAMAVFQLSEELRARFDPNATIANP